MKGKLPEQKRKRPKMKERPSRYTLDELIAQCDPKAPLEKDRSWVTSGPVERELI